MAQAHVDPKWPRASEWLARNDPDPGLMVIGVPTSSASISPSEAWRAPRLVRDVLRGYSTFHGEHGIDLSALAVADAGDWDVAALDPVDMLATVDSCARALGDGPVHAFIGGDNAITRPVARARADRHLEDLGVLTFDAHHDVRLTEPVPTNGSPIRGLIEDGLPAGQVIQVGIHSFANSRQYRAWCADHDIRVLTMADVEERGIDDCVSRSLDHLSRVTHGIHVDFDLDVLDRAFAPGCPGSRPGGMTPRQLARAAYLCGRNPAVMSVDLVEVDPTRDVNQVTLHNMANVLLSFAAGLAWRLGLA